MKVSQFFLGTQKETPADAEIISHQLMIKAGLIRKLAAGLYNWLPLGLRVLRKVENIVREEMNNIGGLEILMPAVQAAEIWQETDRWNSFGPELLKFKDRHERDMVIAPTHEEAFTDLIRHEFHSYKQLPVLFYQIQGKFRDETRPRSGIMRAREFLMKDAYSLHLDPTSLEQTYQQVYIAYRKIFDRLGLRYRAVLADTGAIGGSISHEFHVLADSGEDRLAISDQGDYAANLECATAYIDKPSNHHKSSKQLVDTPNQKTIADISNFLKLPTSKCIKTLIVKGVEDDLIALVLRGDHELNDVKIAKLKQIAQPLQLAPANLIKQRLGCDIGSLGPVGLSIPMIIDHSAAALTDFACGANQDDKHFINVNWGTDANLTTCADLRSIVVGDRAPDGKGTLQITRGIEVGHIFQLGTKYSQAMNAQVLNEAGKPTTMQMGCYGIGVSRIVAAAIEQNHDANGIIWPDAIAPFILALVPINLHKSAKLRESCDKLYQQLLSVGFEVLYDDRDERPGVKFADMDLLGIPHRIVVSERSLENGLIEYKARASEQKQDIKYEDFINWFKQHCRV